MSATRAQRSIVITVEHGGNEVPEAYRPLFENQKEALESHRGWDPGARTLAGQIAPKLGTSAITSEVTRLLVDLNRSAHNPQVFSATTRALPRPERVALLERYHRPHWDRARSAVSRGIAQQGTVVHLGVHSFTPVLDGKVRKPDLALLYDPSRPGELELATRWCGALAAALPDRLIRRNNPYLGTADGMTTAFRRAFPGARYLGIEIEVNQRLLGPDGAFPSWVGDALVTTLNDALKA
jgi:predicted N-formylglutamate amidohydrolase